MNALSTCKYVIEFKNFPKNEKKNQLVSTSKQGTVQNGPDLPALRRICRFWSICDGLPHCCRIVLGRDNVILLFIKVLISHTAECISSLPDPLFISALDPGYLLNVYLKKLNFTSYFDSRSSYTKR
jgi:hypothetical protein